MYKAVFNKPESITLLSTEQIKFDLFRGRWILVEVFNGHTFPMPLLYQFPGPTVHSAVNSKCA